jgi:hypothetical protein
MFECSLAVPLQEVKDWIASHLPYWNKTQGRDHIFLALHDEGAWWVRSLCSLDCMQELFT